MVIPFLSLYLTEDLKFSYAQVGWIMSAFGAGSIVGSWLGGKITDKIGFYPVVVASLFSSGVFFISFQYLQSFAVICIGIFLLMLTADALRPAIYVAVNTYSKPQNRTRSITLIRLAINLGFSVGPAAGGLLVVFSGYSGIFWADGLTCIIAGAMFILLLDKRQSSLDSRALKALPGISPYRDVPYLLFLFIVFLIGFAFLQLFSSIPLYYRQVYSLPETSIGLLMAVNGLVIFIFEMPAVKYIEYRNIPLFRIISISCLLLGISFLIFNISEWAGVLIISMLFITIGELLNFPFLNRFALDRAQGSRSGDYMALFTISFSFAHLLGPNTGMQLIGKFGFRFTWYVMFCVFLLAILLVQVLKLVLARDPKQHL
jgi:predicted MFS family arabinose efflux permease